MPAPDTLVAEVRSQVRTWLDSNWNHTMSLVEWRSRLRDAGWAYPTWPPNCGGRSLPDEFTQIVREEIVAAGAVGAADGAGVKMAAATIYDHGTEDQKERFVAPTITGELSWCQLFSEPAAGSDLASLTTTAVLRGSEWIVNGRKLWTTGAATADYAMLLARTDDSVPKHQGITFFVLPMHQPGVLVRPLKQMNGHATFNEVFLDDVRIPISNVIGRVDKGWTVALTTLMYERRLGAETAAPGQADPDSPRAVREATEEQIAAKERRKWYPQRSGRVDLVIERARAMGRTQDPIVRQEICRLLALAWTSQWTKERAAAAVEAGLQPGPEAAVGKLSNSNVARAASRVHALIAGSNAMLAGQDEASGGVVSEVLLSVPAISIAGGTDEIQRNVLGERILGLPKEIDDSRTIAFCDIAHAG